MKGGSAPLSDQLNSLIGLIYDRDSAYVFSIISQIESDLKNGSISESEAGIQYLELSEFFFDNSQFTTSEIYLNKVREIGVRTSDSLLIYRSQVTEARHLMNKGQRAEAQVILLRALDHFQKANDSLSIASTFRLVGNNYDYLGEHDVALDYYERAKIICQKLKDYALLARIFDNTAGLYEEENEHEKSIKEYEVAIKYANLSGDRYILHSNYHGLSILYATTGDTEKSLRYLRKSIEVAGADELRLGFSYQSFGFLYKDLKLYDSARYYFKKTVLIGRKYHNSQLTENALEGLVEVNYQTGRYKEAFDLQRIYQQHHDSIYNQKNSAILEAIRSQYQNEKNERELLEKNLRLEVTEAALRQQVILRRALFAIILLLSLSIFLVYRGYKIRHRTTLILTDKNREIEAQKQRIQQANEAKSRWLINFAHEFKTPLTLIIGPVSRLLSIHQKLEAETRDDLILVEKNARKLSSLVNEILELSRLEEGGVELNKNVLNLADVVKGGTESFGSLAGGKGVKVKAGHLPSVFIEGDRDKLIKVLSNLLSNAVKFTTTGDSVTVSLAVDEEVRVTVSDTGCGIPPEDLPFVFDRYYQSVNQSIRPAGGTGIGLALSKEIAVLHGGDILVESEPGKGSAFTLVLPSTLIRERIEGEAPPHYLDLESDKAIRLQTPAKKPELLLVEDNEDMRIYVSSLLQSFFNVNTAGSGSLALEIIKQKSISFIISDVMMPDMDGIDFSRKIKSNPDWRWIPFIHLSALSNDLERKEALRIGVDDFLHKPFDPDELLIRVSNLYNNSVYRLEKELPDESEPSFDEKILKKLRDEVTKCVSDSNYTVYRLAESAAMSERQIYRFLKQATGLTPLQFIQEIKLTRAMELVQKRVYSNTSELARAVGFQHGPYFTGLFTKRFGKRPSDYLKV